MEHKDTLSLYDELRGAGVPETQARAQAKQLGAVGDILGHVLEKLESRFQSIDSRFQSIEMRLQSIDKDMFWMRVIGGAMVAAFFTNIVGLWVK